MEECTRWRHRRPVAGGLFLLLAGGWVAATAQLTVPGLLLERGTAGLAAWLVPAALLGAGLLTWFAPRRHLLWAVLGGGVALYALVGLNLGGFFVGTLLGVVGAALTAGWTPGVAVAAPARHRAREQVRPATALTLLAVSAAVLAPPAARPALAVPCPPGVIAAGDATEDAERTPAPIRPSPGSAEDRRLRERECSPDDLRPGPVVTVTPPAGQEPVAGQQVRLTGGAVDMAGLSYAGVVELPMHAGTIRALRFTMDSTTATDVELRLRGPHGAAVVTGGALMVEGDVELYATRLAGSMAGVRVEYSPAAPPPAALKGISLRTPALDVVLIESDRVILPALSVRHER
ncbi:hypothetical protein GCM10010123_44000 [Pilimelia anulata]|uniref:Uncharacterized protein n=1 Tax=Pilimelia anulata TaxID=53371 RepID=A0A8J3BHU3_9ACTN|nr:DUF6114 domain-containing protein [Pilimelia anulata]GGK09319.1 hypothetical protein GCM10010123_44000 [Pilimelia anulata]